MASTDVPVEYAKGIYINTIVIVASEKLWSHVDGSTNNTAWHHCLWLAETQISQLGSIASVQLQAKSLWGKKLHRIMRYCSLTYLLSTTEMEILTSTFFSFMSLCTRPWECRNLIPWVTSREICKERNLFSFLSSCPFSFFIRETTTTKKERTNYKYI